MSAEIPDGDLVRLARDGDPVAFRLLVERYQPTVRARARSLCGNPSDVDDVVQESFLRAFIGLDRLRDPDRFAGWLGSIVANVCRGLGRRAPVTLLPDWPEPLHPAAAHGLPSADDLDRADVLRAAVAGLPAGQRRAIALHYYADLPASQITEPAGAARASLHKARLKLRAYLIEHRPDLVPVASRRTPVTTVRVARVERRIPPGPEPIGFPAHVIMLADDAGRRELPIWAQDFSPRRLSQLLELPAADHERAETTQARTVDQLAARLLRGAGASVTGVDIDELGPEVPVARIDLVGPAGTRHVTARVAEGLAVAVAAGAPVRVAEALMDRLALPLPDDGGPVPLPEPAAALAVLSPGRHPRYEPRSPPDSPSSPRKCSPTTTAAPWSPSAASSAPRALRELTSRKGAPRAAQACSFGSSAGGMSGSPSPRAPPSTTLTTTSSRSRATATGRIARSRRGSPMTPTLSCSDSSSSAAAGSRCATWT